MAYDLLDRIEPYAAAVRKLLKGVVYHDDTVWSQIRDYELPIRDYLAQIGLTLHLDEIGNFAYIYDETQSADLDLSLPSLTTRRALSFPDTLLLVLLRERYDEHEGRNLDGGPLFVSQDDLLEMVSVFMGQHPDARKVEQRTVTSINRLKRYGFLTERKSGQLEVRPLIRAKISADELEEFKNLLSRYVAEETEAAEEEEEDDDET